jgi:5-oxoprolinase (ATP-hydrolysing)
MPHACIWRRRAKIPGATRWWDSGAPVPRMPWRSPGRSVQEVIVPPASGAASALGFLVAPLSFESVRSLPVTLASDWPVQPIEAVLSDLEQEARGLLSAAGVSAEAVNVKRLADMRLAGQIHEITVNLPEERITPSSFPAIEQVFRTAYNARYTSVYEGAAMQILNLRVRCSAAAPELKLTKTPSFGAGAANQRRSMCGLERAGTSRPRFSGACRRRS